MRNIELKARLTDLDRARKIAGELATHRIGTQHQVDTYFHCRHGRLKLRQIDGLSAQLVWYSRSEQRGPKTSDYLLVPIANPQTVKAALAAALGVQVVVEKRREIVLVGSIRVHLDEVAGLGTFLEFEAVLGPRLDEAAAQTQVARLAERFAIDPADLVAGSYADLRMNTSAAWDSSAAE